MIGVFRKDEFTGDFVDGWKATLSDTSMTQVSCMYIVLYMTLYVDNTIGTVASWLHISTHSPTQFDQCKGLQ